MWEITCGKCGGKSAAGLWLENALGVKFPAGHLQCPLCKVAVVRKQEKPELFDYDGQTLVIPGRITLVPEVTIS